MLFLLIWNNRIIIYGFSSTRVNSDVIYQPYTAPQVAWRQAQQMSFSDNRQRQSETQQKQQPPQQQTWQQRETEQQHEQQTWQQQPHQPQQQTWQQQQHHQDQHQQPSHHAASTSSSQPPAGLNDPAQQVKKWSSSLWTLVLILYVGFK